jgi:hypothetical protein
MKMTVFSSAELKMSLVSSPEIAIISKEEMEIKMKDFAAGFGDKIEYVKSHTGPIQKKIEGASFIAGILSSKKEEKRQVSNCELKRRVRFKNKYTILDTMLTAYADAISQIITKLKLNCDKFPLIQKVMTTTVTLKTTNEDIANPYETCNLAGIIECLHERYRKKLFNTFTNSLIKLISGNASESDYQNCPWEKFEKIEVYVSAWRRKELFAHLTEDVLFSAVYL